MGLLGILTRCKLCASSRVIKLSEEELLVLCVCISLTLVKRSPILDGTDKRETSYIKEETVST